MRDSATVVGGLLQTTSDGIITYATGFPPLGWTTADLIGRDCFDFIHPNDLAESRHRFTLSVNGYPSHGIVNRWRTKDGGWSWMTWSSTEIDGQLYYHGLRIPEWLVPVEAAVTGGCENTAVTMTTTGTPTLPRQYHHGENMCEHCVQTQADNETLRQRVAELEAAAQVARAALDV